MINEKELSDKMFKVDDGVLDSLVVYGEIKQAIALLQQAEKQLKDDALEEASKYDSKFELSGINFEYRKGGRYYDYKHDDKWIEINSAKKQREDLMKEALKGQEIYDGDGEEIPAAIVNYKSDSLIVK